MNRVVSLINLESLRIVTHLTAQFMHAEAVHPDVIKGGRTVPKKKNLVTLKDICLLYTSVVGVFREADPNCNVAFGPIPQSDNAKENLVGTSSDNDLMVLKGGNTDGAMAFINFMASDEGRDIWAKTTGNLSASSAEVASGVDPMNLSAYEWVKNGQIYMRGDLVTLSGNVNSEWQSLTQKFIVEGYAANKSGTSRSRII